MNPSIHRVGLAVAALAVVVAVGGFFVADGYLSARRTASAAPADLITRAAASPTPTGAGTVPPEVVYVRPAPSPKVIHVTRTAPPAPPQVVHVTVPAAAGEGGDGEGGGETDGGGD
jgi:hypothetical protein